MPEFLDLQLLEPIPPSFSHNKMFQGGRDYQTAVALHAGAIQEIEQHLARIKYDKKLAKDERKGREESHCTSVLLCILEMQRQRQEADLKSLQDQIDFITNMHDRLQASSEKFKSDPSESVALSTNRGRIKVSRHMLEEHPEILQLLAPELN